MKPASPTLAALIESGNFDTSLCYTFSLRGGGTVLLSEATFTIKSGATVWPGLGPLTVDGGTSTPSLGHWKVGSDVDQWQLTIAPRLIDAVTGATLPDKIGDQPFLAAVRARLLAGAGALVQEAYFDRASGYYPPAVGGATPVGFLTIFRGSVGPTEVVNGQAIITLLDFRQLLQTQMPRNIYQAGCQHTLYDSGCKLSAPAFRQTGSVTAVQSRSLFSTSAPAPAGSGTYDLGRVTITSGENAGITRTIQSWDGAQLVQVSPPFPFAIAVGDAASMYPGCDKTMASCTAFGNLNNFGGNPYIPPPTVTSPTG